MKKRFVSVFCASALLALSACQTLDQTSTGSGAFPESPNGVPKAIQEQIDQLVRLGTRTAESGDTANAIGFYQKAYSLNTRNSEALFLYAETSKRIGDYRGAERLYSEALAVMPDNVEVRRRYANTLVELDKITQAIVQLEKALEIKPDHAKSMNSLGVAYDLASNHEKAQELYRKSLTVNPKNTSTLNNLALSLALSGKYDEALEEIGTFELDMTTPKRLRMNLALIYGLKGDTKAAERVASQILDREAVEHNLRYYEALRQMTIEKRKKFVLGKPGS